MFYVIAPLPLLGQKRQIFATAALKAAIANNRPGEITLAYVYACILDELEALGWQGLPITYTPDRDIVIADYANEPICTIKFKAL